MWDDEKARQKAQESKYKADIEEQMKFFIQKGLLGPINNFQQILKWIQQFPSESLTPYFLLDALIVVPQQQAQASLENILEQIKASLYKDNPTLSDEELFALYKEHMTHSVFVGASLPGDTASGAPQIMRELRKILKGKFFEAAVSQLCGVIQERQIAHVYIVDDIVGTGETITKRLKYEEWCTSCPCKKAPTNCSLEHIANCHPNIDFTVISVIMHEKGKNRIKGRFQSLMAYTVDTAYNLLSKNCVLYRDKQYREAIIDDIKKIMDEHNMRDNKYALYLPVAICDEFPNNSLELFWWPDSSKWYPLLRRVH